MTKAVARVSGDQLQLLTEARALLERAATVPEAKSIGDKAEALRVYAARAGEGLDMQNHCAELKLRAERKAGELLSQATDFGRGKKSVTVTDFGIDHNQAKRWQQLARIPEADFEAHLAAVRGAGVEITSSAALRLAKQLAGGARPERRPMPVYEPPGSLWRIFCRDARDFYDDAGADLAIFSPPYNVGVEYDEHDDGLPHEDWCELLYVVGKVLAEGWGVGRICVNTPMGIGRKPYQPLLPAVLGAFSGFTVEAVIVWDKGTTGGRTTWGSWRNPANPSIRDRTELITVFRTANELRIPDGALVEAVDEGRTVKVSPLLESGHFTSLAQDLWTMPPAKREHGHPTPFPVELPERLIRLYGWPGCTVVDPFAGSGTTGVAALRLGAHAALVDVSEAYCDVMHERLQKELDDAAWMKSGKRVRPDTGASPEGKTS